MTDPPNDPPGPQRITRTLVATLRALNAPDAELHVAQLSQAASISPNTALVLARRMEGWGALEARWSEPTDGTRPVRLFKLTDAGRRLAQHVLSNPVPEGSGTC